MITIEELKRVSVDMLEVVMFALSQHEEIKTIKTFLREIEHLSGTEKGNLCARIIHMKDEIERLRAKVSEAQDAAYEIAAQCVEERGRAIGGAIAPVRTAAGIRALKSGEPK